MNKRRIVSLLLALALCLGLSAPALAAEFTDVPPDHYAHDAIQTAAAKGIVSGYADGSFKPNNPVTYGQFAVMLARAFFPEDLAKYEAQGKAEGKPWHWGAAKTLQNPNRDIITYHAENPQLERVASTPISRKEMAHWLYNLLLYRGFKASYEEKMSAINQLSDINGDSYVGTVCFYGIISGYPDGTFGPDKTMNRAQACVVIDRTAKMIGYGADRPTTVAVTKKPCPFEPGTVMLGTPTDGWTCCEVADNNYPDGTLNNGKPITEENVLEMLKEAKKIWPDGLSWGGIGGYPIDNNYYDYGSVYSLMAKISETLPGEKVGADARKGCGGFACMLSDYLFGKQTNPPRKLDDNTQVRPGDIVFHVTNHEVTHVSTALTTAGKTNNGNFGIKSADGNIGGIVGWDDTATNYPTWIASSEPSEGRISYCVIYTRYPE